MARANTHARVCQVRSSPLKDAVDEREGLADSEVRFARLGGTHANGAGGGVGLDVADADVPADDADLGSDAQALAAEDDDGLAAGLGADFDVGPGDAAAPP